MGEKYLARKRSLRLSINGLTPEMKFCNEVYEVLVLGEHLLPHLTPWVVVVVGDG